MSRASHKRRWRTHTVVGIGEVQSSRPVIWKYDFELENWFGKAESAEPGSNQRLESRVCCRPARISCVDEIDQCPQPREAVMSQGPDSLFQPPQAQMSPSHGMLKRDVQFGFTYACAEINERPGQCGGWKRTKFGHVCAGQCGGPADFGPIARRGAGLSLACNLWRGPATTG